MYLYFYIVFLRVVKISFSVEHINISISCSVVIMSNLMYLTHIPIPYKGFSYIFWLLRFFLLFFKNIKKSWVNRDTIVWSYNANNTLNLHKWSSSNILASMDSFWCLLSKSAGTPATTLGHFFLFRMPDLDLFKIQNLINSDEIIQIGIVLPPVVITNITFTLKFAHDLIRSS